MPRFFSHMTAYGRPAVQLARGVCGVPGPSRGPAGQPVVDAVLSLQGLAGKSLITAEAHKGQRIDPTEFNALVEDLIKSRDSQKVLVPVQNRLLVRMAAQRGEVMGK